MKHIFPVQLAWHGQSTESTWQTWPFKLGWPWIVSLREMPLGRLDRAVSHPLVERGGLASGGSPAALPMAVSWPCSPTKTESLKLIQHCLKGGVGETC